MLCLCFLVHKLLPLGEDNSWVAESETMGRVFLRPTFQASIWYLNTWPEARPGLYLHSFNQYPISWRLFADKEELASAYARLSRFVCSKPMQHRIDRVTAKIVWENVGKIHRSRSSRRWCRSKFQSKRELLTKHLIRRTWPPPLLKRKKALALRHEHARHTVFDRRLHTGTDS